jgi:hypothetical protein
MSMPAPLSHSSVIKAEMLEYANPDAVKENKNIE